LQIIWAFHHLLCIKALKDSENPEKSLYTGDKAKKQNNMFFGGTVLKMNTGTFLKSFVGEHSP